MGYIHVSIWNLYKVDIVNTWKVILSVLMNFKTKSKYDWVFCGVKLYANHKKQVRNSAVEMWIKY